MSYLINDEVKMGEQGDYPHITLLVSIYLAYFCKLISMLSKVCTAKYSNYIFIIFIQMTKLKAYVRKKDSNKNYTNAVTLESTSSLMGSRHTG